MSLIRIGKEAVLQLEAGLIKVESTAWLRVITSLSWASAQKAKILCNPIRRLGNFMDVEGRGKKKPDSYQVHSTETLVD